MKHTLPFQQGILTLVSKLLGCSHGTEPGLSINSDFFSNETYYFALEFDYLAEIKHYKNTIRI